ncbi:hypothetical protein [Vibrio diabolicus]|uniref:hypothetical protein n=1 Tax=Vibrio diabolicus TaxID=50719 RepID=UPI0015F6599A|nr:hypothetical protein [Vibrio diabolicus]
MSYKDYRASLNIGEYVDDIYVEVRDWDHIVAFIDAHDRNSLIPPLDSRMPLLARFSSIAPSYYIEYQSVVNNSEIMTHPSPLQDIIAYNTRGQRKVFNCDELKGFIEGLGGYNLANRLPRPPRFPQEMSSYSVWHYKLDYNCLCRDIDYTEFRNGQISAFIETTGKLNSLQHLRNSFSAIQARLDLQRRIMSNLSNRFNTPSFIVLHLSDLSYFEVYDLEWNLILEANQQDYSQWLRDL